MFKGTVADQGCLTVVNVQCSLGEISASTKDSPSMHGLPLWFIDEGQCLCEH